MKDMKKLTEGMPKTVNILGTPYKIIYSEHIPDDKAVGLNDWYSGVIHVQVDKERPKAGNWKVLFHEIVHGIVEEYQILEILELNERDQERVVDNLATGLYDTMVRNKLVTFS